VGEPVEHDAADEEEDDENCGARTEHVAPANGLGLSRAGRGDTLTGRALGRQLVRGALALPR